MAHSPTPYHIDAMGNIWNKDTKIAEMSDMPIQAENYRPKSLDEHKANTEFLVTAANEHDHLKEINAALLGALQNSAEVMDAWSKHTSSIELKHSAAKARAAISLAEGR